MTIRLEKDNHICSDSNEALKFLLAVKLCSHWYDSSKACWMIILFTIQWDSSGSMNILV